MAPDTSRRSRRAGRASEPLVSRGCEANPVLNPISRVVPIPSSPQDRGPDTPTPRSGRWSARTRPSISSSWSTWTSEGVARVRTLASVGGQPYNQSVTRDQVLQRLAEARAELAGLGVRSLDLFGSVARGEAGPNSDVDLLVEFDKPIGLFHFVRVQQRLEAILGCRVDLVMRDAVKRQLRDRILAEAVRAT